MDGSSPVSLNLGLPFTKNSQLNTDDGVADSGADHTSSFSQNIGDTITLGAPSFGATQDRASIDSAFDQDILTSWSPLPEAHHGRNSSSTSVHFDVPEDLHDLKSVDKENTPVWSELKTKAGKERKRLPLACIDCRRKKIKCSGEKPACKHCVKARVPCVYKNTTRKAAPRTDYMAMLDKRLKRMEDRVIKMIPKEDMPDLNATGRSSARPPVPGPPTKQELAGGGKSAEDLFSADPSERTQPKRPPLSEGKTQSRIQREFENKLSVEGADALPPPNIQEHLAELFFECIYGQSYLLLHKPSFIRKLKARSVPPVLVLAVCAVSARFSAHPQVSTEPAFLRGEQWATAARRIVERRHFEPNVTVLTVMLILGMHYFGTCEGGLSWSLGGQASRMAYALQLHRELDHDPLGKVQEEKESSMGDNTSFTPQLSFTDREIRRRLMWACYLMDIFNSSGTERPPFLNEEYIKIQLPIKESHFQQETSGLTEDVEGHVVIAAMSKATPEQLQAEAKANLGVAAYVIRAVVIWKRIVQYLNLGGKDKDPHMIWDPLSQFASLQRQIQYLRSSLPDSLKYTPENLAVHVSERLGNQLLFLHIVLAQNSLFLHRFAIPTAPNTHRPYPPNTPKPFLATCATTVVESASFISKILADSSGHTFTVPFAGYCAYAAATVHVWGIFSRNPALEESSQRNLRHNYKYLTRMKRHWAIFHYMAQSVKDIYRAFSEAANSSKNKALHKTATSKEPTASSSLLSAASTDQPQSPTDAAIDTLISADPSRAPSPTPDRADSADQSDGKAKHDDKTKQRILQYGDWFNKYPHGVSEAEWDITHHPHKGDSRPGQEAVMSQKSELRSVEEFMASLTPPSKAAAADLARDRQSKATATATNETTTDAQQGRGKKIARRGGRSVAEIGAGTGNVQRSGSTSAAVNASMGAALQQQRQQQQQHHRQIPTSAPMKTSSPSQQVQQQQPKTQRQGSGTAQTSFHDLSTTLDSVLDIGMTAQDFNKSEIDIPMSDFASADNTQQQQQRLQSQAVSSFDVNQTSNSPSYFGNNMPSGLTPTASQRGFLDFEYNSPSTISNPSSAANPQSSRPGGHMNFNFNYTSALPHLDRQMVFGAYAGLDPSTTNNSSALNNPNNIDFWGDPWDSTNVADDMNTNRGSIDMDGFGALGDLGMGSSNAAGIISSEDSGVLAGNIYGNTVYAGSAMKDRANSAGGGSGNAGDRSYTSAPAPAPVPRQQGDLTAGMGSSAWFMPFNIDPPFLDGLEDFSSFDAMDMSGEMARPADRNNSKDDFR